MSVGRYNRTLLGMDFLPPSINVNGIGTASMAALNTGTCYRFMALDTRDVKSVWINWNSVSTPGTVQLRIETIDATTGKPSGSLYDANAVKSFTPSAAGTGGWQNVVFDVLPTTGLTPGTEYALVLLTTVIGTTQTLRSSIFTGSNLQGGVLPAAYLTAVDGTTRSNFAEAAGQTPIGTLVMEDDEEILVEWCAYYTAANTSGYSAFGTQACGAKIIVPTGGLVASGVESPTMLRQGTPAGDLRLRLFNSSDAVVAGTTVTVDKDSLTNASGRRTRLPFPGLVTLAGGTYRIVFDSASSANSSNCWAIRGAQARGSNLVPSGLIGTRTADVTAGTISWTDEADVHPNCCLVLSDITDASGSGGGPAVFLWTA